MIKLKNLLSLFVLFLLPLGGSAQINLVLNPSFEDHWRCPVGADQIKFANFWSPIDTFNSPSVGDSFGSPNCTPEYINVCGLNSSVIAPANDRFFQFPRTGNGMAQVMTYNAEYLAGDYQRDYLQGRLKSTLESGHEYCVTFYTSQESASAFSINHIGAYFDNRTIDTTTHCGWVQTSHTPQIIENVIIVDTLNWKKIQGSFIANGAERFVTIGNFSDVFSTDTLSTYIEKAASFGNTILSWYLIDDVSVIDIGTAHAYAGHDTSIALHDSVWVGNQDGYLPCYWYKNGVLVDSNVAGFWARPDTSCYYTMALDVCGNITRDTMHITVGHVGIPEHGLALAEGIKLFPNPTLSELAITGLAGNTEYRVLSVTGAAMLSGHLHRGANTVDMSGPRSGVYMIELVGEDGERSVRRVVKE